MHLQCVIGSLHSGKYSQNNNENSKLLQAVFVAEVLYFDTFLEILLFGHFLQMYEMCSMHQYWPPRGKRIWIYHLLADPI